MEYYIRRLTYGKDLTTEDGPTPLNRVVSPKDIITHELCQLTKLSSTPPSLFLAVDPHCFWFTDLLCTPVSIATTILNQELAMDQIRTT